MLKKAYVFKGSIDDYQTLSVDPIDNVNGQLEDIKSINDESTYIERSIENPLINYNKEFLDITPYSDFNSRYYIQNKFMDNGVDDQFYDFSNQVWIKQILNDSQKIDDYINTSTGSFFSLDKPEEVPYFDSILYSNPVKHDAIVRYGALTKQELNPVSRYNFKPNNVVKKTIIDESNGDFYIVGRYTSILDRNISKITKVCRSTYDTGFEVSITGFINDILVFGNKLIIVGKFSVVNGTTRTNFAVVDKFNGALLSDEFDVNGEVFSISLWDTDKLFICGDFSDIDGNTRNNIALANLTTFTVLPDLLNTNGDVTYSFVDSAEDYLYICGEFSEVNQPDPTITINAKTISEGSGYTIGDVLTLVGGDATVEVTNVSSKGPISSYTIINPGSGYSFGDIVNDITGGATFQVTSVSGPGMVMALSMMSGGSEYSPSDMFLTDGGSGFGLQISVNTVIPTNAAESVTLLTQPSDFTYSVSDVSTTGGTGSGAIVRITSVNSPNPPLYYLCRIDLSTLTVDNSWRPILDDFAYMIHFCESYIACSGLFTTLNSNNCGRTCLISTTTDTVFSKISDNPACGFAYDLLPDVIYCSGPELVGLNGNRFLVKYDVGSLQFFDLDLFFKYQSQTIPPSYKGLEWSLEVNDEFIFAYLGKNEFGNFYNISPQINFKDYEVAHIGDNTGIKYLNDNGLYKINNIDYFEKKIDHFNGYIDIHIDDIFLRRDLFRQLYNNIQLNKYTNKKNQKIDDILSIISKNNISKFETYQKIYPSENFNYTNNRDTFNFPDWKDFYIDEYEKHTYKLLNIDNFDFSKFRIEDSSTQYRYNNHNPNSYKSKWPLDYGFISGTLEDGTNDSYLFFGELFYVNESDSINSDKRKFTFSVPVSLSYDGYFASSSFNEFESGESSFFTNNPCLIGMSDIIKKSNSKPFFNNEDEFDIFMRKKYRKHSIISEYNSSEHIDELINNIELDNIFTCTGSNNYQLDFNFKNSLDYEIGSLNIIFEYNKLFRPYDGLYPVQQGLLLSEIMSGTLSGSVINDGLTDDDISIAMLYFYRPGIFWNSLSLNVPINEAIPKDNSTLPSDKNDISSISFDGVLSNIEKIPFETIYNPFKYLKDRSNRQVADYAELSLFNSGSLLDYPTTEYTGPSDNYKYSEIINNFYSGINDFFLQNDEKVKIMSISETELPTFISGSVYGMKISIRRNVENISDTCIYDCGTTFETNTGGVYNSPHHIPIYRNTEGAGGKTTVEDLLNFKILFYPTETRKYTFSEIFDLSTGTYISTKELPLSSYSYKQSIESCFDIFNFEKDENDSIKWVPTLKQEFPSLNHEDNNECDLKSSNVSLDTGSISGMKDLRGYMRNYGKLSDDGLYIEISDILGFTKDKDNNDIEVTESLCKAFRIDTKNIPLGKFKKNKTISELVCLVPYDSITKKNISIDNNHKNFIQNKDYFSKYVFPNNYDYINGSANPYLMYCFECNMNLDSLDLSHIWQNVMPSKSFTFEEDSISIKETDKNICKLVTSENINWQIFKVKLRQKYNINKSVNYNWPYDFFSIVECGSLYLKTLHEENE